MASSLVGRFGQPFQTILVASADFIGGQLRTVAKAGPMRSLARRFHVRQPTIRGLGNGHGVAAVFRPRVSLFCDPGGGPFRAGRSQR